MDSCDSRCSDVTVSHQTSLISYLASLDSGALDDLERENAHFYISELVMGTVERMKWSLCNPVDYHLQACHHAPKNNRTSSECVANNHKEPRHHSGSIDSSSCTRSVTQTPSAEAKPAASVPINTTVKSNVSGHAASSSSAMTSPVSPASTSCLDDSDQRQQDLSSPAAPNHHRKTSSQILPQYVPQFNSPQEVFSDQPSVVRVRFDTSAEAIALALLEKFADRYIPDPEDCDWVVPFEQAPQQLLPFPHAITVGGNEAFFSRRHSATSPVVHRRCCSLGLSTTGSRNSISAAGLRQAPDEAAAAVEPLRDRSASTASSVTLLTNSGQSFALPRLRGNNEWAPPRSQIIYHLHRHNTVTATASSRHQAIVKQNYRCAGCGVRQHQEVSAESEQHRMRLCEYYGKYFCSLCHAGDKSIIPARILDEWNFAPYPVCRIALSLIEQIEDEPIFDIEATNPALYRKSRALADAYELRRVIQQLVPYIVACSAAANRTSSTTTTSSSNAAASVSVVVNRRFPWTKSNNSSSATAAKSHQLLMPPPMPSLCSIPSFMTQTVSISVHSYSLKSLREVKSGRMRMRLERFVALAFQHINAPCGVCQANGHSCEKCRKKEIIFPFQFGRVHQCVKCKACFHRKCYAELLAAAATARGGGGGGNWCPACARREQRQHLAQQQLREIVVPDQQINDITVKTVESQQQ